MGLLIKFKILIHIYPIGREYSLLISFFPILNNIFCKDEKIGPRRPQWAACGSWGIVDQFLWPRGLRASLTKTLKNQELPRAPPENALAFYKSSLFLPQVYLALIIFFSLPPLSFSKLYSSISYQESFFWKFLLKQK